MTSIKRVAVIGAGPAGAIAIDTLAREKAFEIIRVFERREGPGGCWIGDSTPPPILADLRSLAERTADVPLPVPDTLPAYLPKSSQPRFSESSIYPYLETNVDAVPMQFSQEPISDEKSAWSIATHGPDTPFRHWTTLRKYIEALVQREWYKDLISYNTTVELVEKTGHVWRVVLRKEGKELDYWWAEMFDAVVVASGHYAVPYVPHIDGLEQLQRARPGSVLHSKHFRGRDQFRGKRVVIVGASVSAADIATDLLSTAETPIHAVVEGHTVNGYFGGLAFDHPRVQKHPSIARVELGLGPATSNKPGSATVHLINGTAIPNVDHIIFGTGYTWTLAFLPSVPTRNNRVPGLWQHVVYASDPTLLFVGAVGAGLTFKIFEWQAVLAARILAGRLGRPLPNREAMESWETDRVREKGDGAKFTMVFPDFEEYFETLREYAGDGADGLGRRLPRFDVEWERRFMEGHELRKEMWRRNNAKATEAAAESNQDGRLGE